MIRETDVLWSRNHWTWPWNSDSRYLHIYILFHIIIYLLYLDGIFGSFWIQIHCFVARRPRPLGLPLPIWWWICQTGPVYWITTPSGKISGRAISTFFSIYHINWQTSRGDRKPSGNHFSETASLHHRFRHVATCLDPSRNTATQNARRRRSHNRRLPWGHKKHDCVTA